MTSENGAPSSTQNTTSRPSFVRIEQAVESMLGSLALSPEHDVLVQLARDYAREIDQGDVETLAKLGPKLESVVIRLGVKPAESGGGEGEQSNPLAEFRASRRRSA